MIPTTSATVVPTEPSSLTVGPPAGAMESAAGTATPETVARCFASDSGVGRVLRQLRSLRRRGHPSEITPSRIYPVGPTFPGREIGPGLPIPVPAIPDALGETRRGDLVRSRTR